MFRKVLGDGFAMQFGFIGIKMVPISTYAILMNLKAMFVILISHFYLKDRMSLKRFILVMISFIGAFRIVKPDFFANLFSTQKNEIEHEDDATKLKLSLIHI